MVLWYLCVLSRSRRLSFLRACVVWPHWFPERFFWLVMGCYGFQTQKNKSWVSGQVRAERVLAEAITIDDRKEWRCKSSATSRRGCKGSISRRSQQNQETGLLVRRARVGSKREKLEAWKPRIKSLEHELMLWERRMEHKRGQVSPLKKKEIRKKCGEPLWKSRMTPSVAENWMTRGKRCRGSYERSKD